MNLAQVALALACVLSISVGQMLFKMVGNSINASGSIFSGRSAALALLAFAIYGVATLAWIYLLRSVPLIKAYPYMALSFCIVPALAFFVLQEKLAASYPIGVVLIVCGVLLVGRSP